MGHKRRYRATGGGGRYKGEREALRGYGEALKGDNNSSS